MSERKDPPEFTPKTCPVCGGRAMNAFKAVSYTHLDVYKRQNQSLQIGSSAGYQDRDF